MAIIFPSWIFHEGIFLRFFCKSPFPDKKTVILISGGLKMGYTLLHTHSENSIKESAVGIRQMLQRAKALGADSVALTDIGNMTGSIAFYREALDMGIKPILGVESIIRRGEDTFNMVILAKDYIGYQGISKIVSDANRSLDIDGNPITDIGVLRKWFADPVYHGHVYAMTGGKDGLFDYFYNRAGNPKEPQKKHNVKKKTSNDLKKEIKELERQLKEEEERKKILIKNAGVDLTRSKKEMEYYSSVNDTKAYQNVKSFYDKYSGIAAQAKEQLPENHKKINSIKNKIARLNKTLRITATEENDTSTAAADSPYSSISERLSGTLDELSGVFGSDLLFEVSPHLGKLNAMIVKEAGQRKTAVVAGCDSYITEDTEKDIYQWCLIRSLKENTWEGPVKNAGAFRMYGKDEMLSSLSLYIGEQASAAMSNAESMSSSCDIKIDASEHYPKYNALPQGETAFSYMEKVARSNIPKRFPGGNTGTWNSEYEERLCYELDVINRMGYCDYTLNVARILDTARQKEDHGSYNGCTVGSGRGSGAGSLVNYLMRITNIDPVKYDLIFERYLNIERVSPPDIDSDIATSIRDWLVDEIREDYAKKKDRIGVCSIMTRLTLAAKASVRAAGRIISSKYFGETKTLLGLSDRMSKFLPSEPHTKLSDYCLQLKDKFGKEEYASEIIDAALLLEDRMFGYGTHAAGVIISDSGDVTDYAPLINIGTNDDPVWNIQCDMAEAEWLGCLKMDMLGLTTLDIIDKAIGFIANRHNVKIDIHNIPFEKEVFENIYSKGDTDCVFQCESTGMKKMWKDLRPDNIEDIIAGISLYRPGPMDYIDDYIKGKRNPSRIRYKTPLLRPILEKTYGQMVYQEQIMRIVRDLAGYSMGRSDLVRRAISKKKESVMNAERKNFVYGNSELGVKGCVNNGIDEKTANEIFDDMVTFASYCFNKSHAAAYAIISYQTAWLKYHYPLEFMAAAMNFAKENKYQMLVSDCRRMGFKVKKPDVNRSFENFIPVGDDTILYGLSNIKGLKKEAQEIIEERVGGYYTGLVDFMERSGAGKSATESLIKAGAFDAESKGRSILLEISEQLRDLIRERDTAAEKISDAYEALEDDSLTAQKRHRLESGRDVSLQKKLEAERRIRDLKIPRGGENVKENLIYEKEILSAYISSHPMDPYENAVYGMTRIGEITEPSKNSYDTRIIVGAVKNKKELHRKKDGKAMAAFILEDKTGEMKAVCFPNAYSECGDLIEDGHVISVTGQIKHDGDDAEDFVIFVSGISTIEEQAKPVIVDADRIPDWEAYALQYASEKGRQLLILAGGFIRDTGRIVSEEILECEGLSGYVCETRRGLN